MKQENLIKKRVIVLALCIVSLLIPIFVPTEQIKAEEFWPEGPQLNVPNAIVMEVNTGTILYEKESHEKHYPASITKILTTLLAIENCDMDEIVTFSADAVFKNEGETSNIARDLGEQMTIEECLYGVMLESANECAYAVAEHVGQKMGGDYRTFIDLMNKRAKEIGCKNSHFNNSNGLPDEEHWTSAYDMALISCEAYRNPEFKTISGTESYWIPPTNKHSQETPLNNHHNILHFFNTKQYVNPYCTGGKTGYTSAANSTLVTYAEKDGLVLCVVVMDADSPDHWIDTNKLIDFCFNNYQALNILENEKSIASSESSERGLLNNNKSFVSLDEEAYIVLPNTVKFSDANFERDENEGNKYTIATLKYTYAGHKVGKVKIVATKAKVESEFFEKIQKDQEDENIIIIKPIYIVVALVAVAILIIMLIIVKKIYDNYYMIRHNMKERKIYKEQYAQKKRRRHRSKKDIMFK